MWAFDYVGGIPSAIQKNILKLVLKFFLDGLVEPDVLNIDDFVIFGNEISIRLSNFQLVKEKLQKASKNKYGIVATGCLVKELRLSIAWKDIFSGALAVHLSGIEFEAEVHGDEKGLEESIWFDAISESIYETVNAVGGLESTLEHEVAELVSEEEYSSSSSDTQTSLNMTKAILKNIIRDVSVEINGISSRIKLSQDAIILVQIKKTLLADDTEDIKASEPESSDPSKAIYVGKTMQLFDFSASVQRGDSSWKIMEIKGGAEDQPALDFSARIFKDQNCEIEGWAYEIHLYIAPEYIEVGAVLLKMLAKEPMVSIPRRSEQTTTMLLISFIKVEVGSMSVFFLESPYQMNIYSDVESVDTKRESIPLSGYQVNLMDSVVTKFSNRAGDSLPTTLACGQYKIGKLSAGKLVGMCESIGLDRLKVRLDRNGLHGELLDSISLVYDLDAYRIQKKFQKALDAFGLKYNKRSNKQSVTSAEESSEGNFMPISAKIAGLDLKLTRDIIPDCNNANLLIKEALITTSPGSSSFSFAFAEVTVNESRMMLETTTLTRKVQPTDSLSGAAVAVNLFEEMLTVIEDEKFLNVASAAEKVQAVQEAIQTASQQNITFSNRGIRMSFSAADLILLRKGMRGLKKAGTYSHTLPTKKPVSMKGLCRLIDFELKFTAESSVKFILSDAAIFACRQVGKYEKAIDVRSDVVSLSRNHQLLVRRILNLSLDNSFKNIIFTAAVGKGGIDPQISTQISALEVKAPVRMDLTVELDFMHQMLEMSLQGTQQQGEQPEIDFTRYFSLYRCSLSPEFPKTWPRSFPSAIFADNIRIVLRSRDDFKAYLTEGVLFLARRHKAPAMPGIYEEGFTYWQEHGYAPVCKLDFLKITGTRKEGALIVEMENQEVAIEMREDSSHIVKHYFDYLSNMSRYGAPKPTEPIPKEPLGKELDDIDELMFASSPKGKETVPEQTLEEASDVLANIDEDFFASEPKDMALLEPSDKWGTVLEVPTSSIFKEETLVIGSDDSNPLIFGQEASPMDAVRVMAEELEELDIDEDYFVKPLKNRDTFPFSSAEFPERLQMRLKLKDFTVKLKLVEGSHFVSKSAKQEAPRKSSLSSYMTAPSSFGSIPCSPTDTASPSLRNYYHQQQSGTSPSTYSKWSALPPVPPAVKGKPDEVEIVLSRINMEADWRPIAAAGAGASDLAALRLAIPSFEVIDRVGKSRWKTLLAKRIEQDEQTPLEDGSTFDIMLRCELSALDSGESTVEGLEYGLKLRLLPLRIHMDQDTLFFLLKFSSASTSGREPAKDEDDSYSSHEAEQAAIEPLFFQHCDISEISLRVDYKPKHIDFTSIRLGNLAEFVNFFQLEGAELRLPAASLRGVKGSAHFAAELVKAWMPYVRNTQIPEMMKGIGPVRTAINLGGGVADLVLLPMQEWKREGRVLRGLKRGAASFFHATALEGARFGARLAVGTQVILEHVDDILEPDAEAGYEDFPSHSKYAGQPETISEGLLSAYQALTAGLASSAQTIIAVPIQVYERSGPEGALKAVIRAVPVALLKPAMGAAEAAGKALMGVENVLDPARGIEIKRKYK